MTSSSSNVSDDVSSVEYEMLLSQESIPTGGTYNVISGLASIFLMTSSSTKSSLLPQDDSRLSSGVSVCVPVDFVERRRLRHNLHVENFDFGLEPLLSDVIDGIDEPKADLLPPLFESIPRTEIFEEFRCLFDLE